MRYLLRAILSGSSTFGLALVVGCGAASDHPAAYDTPREFRVERSITSAAPRHLASAEPARLEITFAHECARLSDAEQAVAPVAARDALPRSVFTVRPALPLATDEPTPNPALVVPPTDRGPDPLLAGAAQAPSPQETVGEWTPTEDGASAHANSPVVRIPSPDHWKLARRLADAQDWEVAAPQAPLPPSDEAEPSEPIVSDLEAAPEEVTLDELVQPEPPAPLDASDSQETPPHAPAPAATDPSNAILVTPEANGPDSHWPSTILPLPPVDGFQPPALSAPLPDETVGLPTPVEAAPPVTQPTKVVPPARQLDTAPQARPIPGIAPQRSAEMEAVSRLAHSRVQNGFALAQRGAIFAARSEFIQALRLLAQAKDTEQHTNRHSQALADGLRAIDEADDLLPSGSRLEADLDLASAIVGHRTPVLHGVDTSRMTVTSALQQYYTFAQEQLALAGDGEPVASMALYGLGKLHATLARHPSTNVKSPEPKSMIYHQAALLVDGRNYLAANDLGVLQVRLGRLKDAREAFLHSLSQQPQAQTWQNLSAVHRHLGETDLAEQAHRRAEEMARATNAHVANDTKATSPNSVVWVDPSEFSGVPKTAVRPTSPEAANRLKPEAESGGASGFKQFLPPWGADKNENKRK